MGIAMRKIFDKIAETPNTPITDADMTDVILFMDAKKNRGTQNTPV